MNAILSPIMLAGCHVFTVTYPKSLSRPPPDPELVDLIEQAFIQGQIDSQKAELAYLWIRAKGLICLG